MNKVLKELKKNKYTTIAILVFFLVILLGFIAYKSFFPNSGKPVYGNRLDGIEEVMVSIDQFNDINTKLKENKIVVESKGSISGRTIKFVITVNEKTKTADAKKLTSIITKELSKEQLAYFDIEIFITSTNEEEKGYPMLGYKHKNKNDFSFSNASSK